MTKYVEMKLGREKRSLLYFTVNDLFDVTSGGIRGWKTRRLQVENNIRDSCTHSSNSPSISANGGAHLYSDPGPMMCRAGPHQ